MFKKLAILAALSSAFSAHAVQSTFQPPADIPDGPSGKTTVALYGLVDLSVQHLNSGGKAPLAGHDQWRLSDGTVYGPGSRIGIRINEDLGNAISAGALLEGGFLANNDNLAQGGRIFGRQGYAFVKSLDVGELRFGRQYMLHDDSINSTNPTGGTTVLAPGAVGNVAKGTFPLFVDASRIDNVFQYITPTYGGFTAKAMLALSQGVQDRYEGLKGAYNVGPFGAELVYEQSKAQVVTNGHSIVNKIVEFGTNYDFGFVKAFAGYQHGADLTTGAGTQAGTFALPTLKTPATTLSAFNLGASSLFGRTLLMANVTHTKYTNVSGQTTEISRFGPGFIYYYTKQTQFYGAFGVTVGDLKDYVNEQKLLQLGFRKFF